MKRTRLLWVAVYAALSVVMLLLTWAREHAEKRIKETSS